MSILSSTGRAGRIAPLRLGVTGLYSLSTVPRKALAGTISLAGAAVILGAIWAAAAAWQSDLPGPVSTMGTFWSLVRNPFYDAGPNDKGIGLQLTASLKRVFAGFLIGTAVAIPLGIVLGASPLARRFMDPVVQVLRPVSPLAWFPIGLVALQSAPNAAIFIVAITSLWPTVINTAQGVSTIPQSHRNVARVFQFNQWKYLTKIVIPYSLPYMLTGLRLSMGIAWLVIVAAEMLSGGTGIGFYVWDSWNALDLEKVMSAILLIGLVGLVLDRCFGFIGSRFSYAEVA
jgi:nitrate/nitrite transport system permease protein